MKRNYRIKIACFLSVLSVSNIEFQKNIYAQNIILHNQRKMSWSERNPVTAKILKALGITAGLAALGLGINRGTNIVLDKMYPERVEEREKLKNMEQKLSEINNKISDYALKDNLSEDEEKNLEKLRKNESWLKERVENKNNTKNKLLSFAAASGVIFLAKGIVDTVNATGKFAKSLTTVSYLKWAFGNFSEMFKGIKNYFKSPPREMQKEDALNLFDIIFEGYYGQKKAVSDLKSHIFDILVARDQAKWKNEKYSKCDVIYLYGPSGVGKSFIAKRLPSILLANGEPLVISSSYFNKEKKESVIDQLVNIESKNSDPEHYVPEKLLPNYMKNNPGGVIIFEEYDKVCTPALDELLRGLIDEGIVNVGGKPLEWSGTVIITSNEDDLSMEGFDPKKTQDLDETKIKEGFTRVEHSKSFLNRIKKVKFENLTVEEYEKVIQDHFYEMSSYWRAPENGGIEIILDGDSLKKLAIEVEKKKQGARPVDLWIIPEIKMAIGEKIKSLMSLSSENENSSIDNSISSFASSENENSSIDNSISSSVSSENENSSIDNSISSSVSSESENSSIDNSISSFVPSESENEDSNINNSQDLFNNIKLIVKYENNKFLVSDNEALTNDNNNI